MRSVRVRFIGAVGVGFLVLAILERASFAGLDAVSGFSPAAGLATAIVAAQWTHRRAAVPAFGALVAVVASIAGETPIHVFGASMGTMVEIAVAAAVMRRRGDPVERPETSAWWVWWGLAAGLGALAGAATFISIDRPAVALLGVAGTWFVGHGAGLVLVSPGVWAGLRWSVTGGWRHRADLIHMVQALVSIAASMVAAFGLAEFFDSPAPLVGPFFALGWLAHSYGHRVTVMASSVVATATLLSVPWWIDIPAGATAFGVTLSIVLGHAAASALAIEASARWHARALLAGVVDIAAEAVLIVDGDGRVMTGNRAALRLFGTGLEGSAVTDLMTGLPGDWTERRPTGVMMEGRGHAGRTMSLEVSVASVDAPGRPMLTVVCRDMTEIRAAVAALRRSAEIIDASPDLIGWTDRHGDLLFLNEAGRQMIGARSDEAIHAWSAAGLLPGEAIAEAEAEGVWRGEAQITDRSGARMRVLQTVVSHRNDEGAVRYYSVLARDISDRYAIEQMKSEFVANITHELRSPLTGVIGYVALLVDGAFGSLPSPAMEALQEVGGSANRLLELINDLLALWRAEDGANLNPEDFQLGDVVGGAVRAMGPVAAGKGVALAFASDDVFIAGDRRQLERAFINLVSNAVKFTPEGGEVAVDVTVRTGRAVVEISDSGIGIPLEELDAVFDRFYRASTAEYAGIPGTGLGLPLVKEIVEAHDGEISVRSVVGEGTTFQIELPMLVRTPVAV